jgi:hypothetical protein
VQLVYEVANCGDGEVLGSWVVSTASSKWLMTDVVAKTGSILIRKRFVDRLKSHALVSQLDFDVISPNGINKIPAYYIIVRVEKLGASEIVQGLLEYAYGALRLVAVDNKELADSDGVQIVAFFETLLSAESEGLKVELIEPLTTEGKAKPHS